jgi:hypothetical protein
MRSAWHEVFLAAGVERRKVTRTRKMKGLGGHGVARSGAGSEANRGGAEFSQVVSSDCGRMRV